MIDWSKIGPANSPSPTAPSTTTPVAPAAPGSLTAPVPSAGSLSGLGSGAAPAAAPAPDKLYHEMSQEQVDQLGVPERIGRGIDHLGAALFGQGNGSFLGGLPGAKPASDALGGLGDIGHNLGDITVAKPYEIGSNILSRIPLSAIPGGADDTFKYYGDWAKANDPTAYDEWQKVKAASDGDLLYGGNLKANWNIEFAKYIDDHQHDSSLGSTPLLAIGRSGIGSLGGAVSNSIQSFLGIASNTSQGALGGLGAFDPSGTMFAGNMSYDQQKALYDKTNGQGGPLNGVPGLAGPNLTDDAKYAFQQLQSGAFTEQQAKDYIAKNVGANRDRVTEAGARLDRGGEVSDIEKQAVEAVRKGDWSEQHANDFINAHGQGVTRNPIGQIAGTVLTDPLTYATLGAGSISSAGAEGARIGEAALGAGFKELSTAEKVAFAAKQEAVYAKLQTTVAAVQADPVLGPAFRISRGLIDPLAVYKPSTAARATTDLLNGSAVAAFGRTYQGGAREVRAVAREFGMTSEVDSAIASYSMDQAHLMVTRQAQHDMLGEGLGESFIHTSPDDLAGTLASNADRDAVSKLTDHMTSISKNTFTPEEDANLSARAAAIFGGDVASWDKRLAKMSFDGRSAMHAVTFKMAEVEHAQAMAAIDRTAYTGTLPLDKSVLVSAQTLDNVKAQALIDSIKNTLKTHAEDPAAIEAATKMWNDAGLRWPRVADIGYAPGGKAQLEELNRELEKQLERGSITRIALDKELNDPALKPMRDMLDRHTGAPEPAAFAPVEGMSPKPLMDEFGWTQAKAQELVDNTQMVPTKMLAPLREIDRRATPELSLHGSLEELQSSIEAGGGMSAPIIVWHDVKSGATVVADGNHRLTVALEQGWDQVPVVVETRPAAEVAQAENIDSIIHMTPKDGIPEQGVIKPSDFFPEADGKRLWNIGFRPDEEVAWGLKRDVNTGRYVVERDPTISHVMDAVPGRQPFSDTTRNILGQVIGPSKAERLNKPIDSIEAMVNTQRDMITGRRLVMNVERRFERSTFDAGIPKPLSKEIMQAAKDVAGLDHTTLRGVKPGNLWNSIHALIPKDLVLKDGSTLNVHIVMDHLLTAAEGDLRVMGLTSVLSQRMRNALRAHGDGANWAGQMTVTMYNKLRYSSPTFLIQRVTDSPYYSILYGVIPVGRGPLSAANAATRAIEENLGRTGLARDFSMDMPEYAARSNFTSGIKSSMQQAGLTGNKLQKVLDAPDAIIAANMTNMLYHRWGDIVKGTLDNLATAAEKADPAMQAEMIAAGQTLQRSFADWRRVYSESAGRVLSDDEVGLAYAQDMLMASRRQVVSADGTIDMQQLIHEGERAMPDHIADIGPIRPDQLAQQLGFRDAAALRRDVTGHVEKVNGSYALVKGEHDIPWLESKLRGGELRAHPDYVRRATAYFGSTWDDFWTHLSRGVEEGGLDISQHYAKEAQDLIAVWAKDRGMDPWEYLSGVMASNIGAKDIETHMGQLMGFLKSGKAKMPMEEWTKQFRATLDVSAQRTLLQEFEGAVNVEDVIKVPEPALWRVEADGSAMLPSAFKQDPGYVYRIETLDNARSGFKPGTRMSVVADAADARQVSGEGIFRVKADATGMTMKAMKANGRLTKTHVAPDQIEMLGRDGLWKTLGPDPMDTIMAKDFPEMVRQRLVSGVPHENPEVEAYIEQFSKWVSDSIGPELSKQTRSDLRRLVEQVPTAHASPFNRTQALAVTLLKNKITDAQADIFRLAEMQTQRTVLERSLNHPLFGLYPSSYMWGKVLPETVKFLAKNPYAATYVIADVQRAIAIQREYDHEMDDKVSAVDRSAGSFLLDYLTPSFPWSDHQARMSPLVRDVLKGTDPMTIYSDEYQTMSPERWVKQFYNAGKEIPGLIDTVAGPGDVQPDTMGGLKSLAAPSSAPTSGTAAPVEISGPTKASALGPILQDDMTRLQSILLEGKSPEQ